MPSADNLTVNEQLTGPHAAGVNSILPKEHGSQFFYLPIIRHSDEEVSNGFDYTALLWQEKRELWEILCFVKWLIKLSETMCKCKVLFFSIASSFTSMLCIFVKQHIMFWR